MARPSQVRLSALISYLTVAFNAVAGLVYTPWLVASIGQSYYGLYTLAMSIMSIFVLDFGMSAAVSKFLSGYAVRGQHEEAGRFLGVAYRMYLGLSAVIALALVVAFLFIDVIYVELSTEQIAVFRVLYVIAGLHSVISFPFLPLNGVLLAQERLIVLRLTALLQRVLSIVLIVLALVSGQGVVALVAVQAFTSILFIAIKMVIVRRISPAPAQLGWWDRATARAILGFSGWVSAAQISQRFIFNIGPSILAVVSGAPQIAVFGLASALEGYVYTVAQALNGLFLPRVSRLLTRDDSSEAILDLMVTVGRIQTYIVGAIVIGFGCVGAEFVRAWVGDGFPGLYLGALLLMLPSLVELPQEIAATAVLATENVRSQAYVYVAMAVVNVPLTFVLGGRFGALGACAAICVSYVVRTLGMNVVYAKRVKLDVVTFFKRTYGSWMLPAALTVAAGIGIMLVVPMGGWLGVAVKSALILAAYATAMYVLGFNNYEKGLIHGLLPARVRQ